MKKALTTFKTEVANAASHPAKLAAYRKKPLATALRYLFWLLFCISLVTSLWIGVMLAMLTPYIGSFVESANTDLRGMYPQNLVITIKDGVLSTNGREPVIVDIPANWKQKMEKELEDNPMKDKEHLITIDTRADISNYQRYKTLVLVTRTGLVVPDDKSDGIRTIPFDKEMNQVITRDLYVKTLDNILPFMRLLPGLAIVGVFLLVLILPFVFAGFSWLWYLAYLAFFTLIAWLLATIMGRKHTYGEVYRLGAYGLTLPLLYNMVTFFVPVLRLPFFFTLIFLVYMGVVFGSEKVTKRKTA